MELFYLKLFLLVASSIVVMSVNVFGVTAYYGIKIYFLVKKERDKNAKNKKKTPPKK